MNTKNFWRSARALLFVTLILTAFPSVASAASREAVLVETLDGNPVLSKNEDVLTNPASTTKLATSLFALHKLGPDYEFETRKHQKVKLRALLKVMLCYSDNYLAESIGARVGGVRATQKFLVEEVGIPASEIHLSSSSGLGPGTITANAMMRVLRELIDELRKHDMTLQDIMPVAGVDVGTLAHRYTAPERAGTVVAKTGTMKRTAGGVSALVGETRTKRGELLFVIFHERGATPTFKAAEDKLVNELQDENGGALPLPYTPLPLPFSLKKGSFLLSRQILLYIGESGRVFA